MNINISAIQNDNVNIKDWICSWFLNSNNAGTYEDEDHKQAYTLRLMTTAWWIWKERRSHVFDNQPLNQSQQSVPSRNCHYSKKGYK